MRVREKESGEDEQGRNVKVDLLATCYNYTIRSIGSKRRADGICHQDMFWIGDVPSHRPHISNVSRDDEVKHSAT